MQAGQELLEDDPDRRLEFCVVLMTLNGHVNRQNCRYWVEENPHWMRKLHTQRPQKTDVWAGIIQDIIIGPFLFDDTLNGARYLRLLQHELMPVLCYGRIPLDYFLWRYLKTKVPVDKPKNIDDLKQGIRCEIRNIRPDIINRVQDEFIFRLGHCQIVNA
ncbi:hypothetical protein NQ318_000203 [Aromia moschata]|uniref:Uncharacterized protein n=1 Tax=Aromia moschata TaxID=1265417 RepID=A0AAV8YLS0_9CUCU|nr:hypothetical protein NQ318_000203 [Aromia moschata]